MTYGDFVLLLPCFLELRRRHPDAHLTAICGGRGYSLCRLFHCIDEVVNLRSLRLGSGLLPTLNQLRSQFGADLVYSIHPFFFGACVAFLLGGKGRIGFAQAFTRLFTPGDGFEDRPGANRWQEWLMKHILLTDAKEMQIAGEHGSSRFLQLLDPVGRPLVPLRGCLSKQYPRTTRANPLVILAPFSGWTPKNWPLSRWVSLATELLDAMPQIEILVCIDPASVSATKGAFSAESRVRLFAPGEDFDLLFRTFAGASLVVSNDSFPLHAGSALDVPAIALLGPNPPHWFGGQSAVHVDLYRKIECSPCVQGRGLGRCLRGFETCAALQELSVAEVGEACVSILAETKPPVIPRLT